MKKEIIVKNNSDLRIDTYLSDEIEDLSRMAIKRLLRRRKNISKWKRS